MTNNSFFWHDYETFGINPKLDRPAQFAGVRTDWHLNIIGEPIELFCQLSDDYLPDPESVAITGITPQTAQQRGLPEYQFVEKIHRELSQPGTCGVGYNTLRFDDELTRHLFWRNLYPPYDREWRNRCSRWDLLDVVRACHAFRPDGVVWPKREDGQPSFKLEHLTAANGLDHGHAHDAVSDVLATIALAQLLRDKQPRLFEHCLKLRNKQAVIDEIASANHGPFLHISGMYGAERNNVALVYPMGWHPTNRNQLIVWDLSFDPAELAGLDTQQVRTRMFTRSDELPDGTARLPIKTIHINRSPIVVGNVKVLSAMQASASRLNLKQATDYADWLYKAPAFPFSWEKVFHVESNSIPADVDEALYEGFIGDSDRKKLDRLRGLNEQQLATEKPAFDDTRLPELFFRYRARNWPQSLNHEEQQRWRDHQIERLITGVPGVLDLSTFTTKLATVRDQGQLDSTSILQLEKWAAVLQQSIIKQDI